MSGLQSSKRYRVVQWATGNVGSRALRRVIEHPTLELVGVWVHSADKAGSDAGLLCGLEPVGVAATNSIEDVLALRPDCVLYMPHVVDYDDLCRLLEAGINIITTRTEFQNPAFLQADLRKRIESACLKGNASLHGSGSSPGFITEAVPIVLASIQRRLDCLTIYEFADCSSRNSPEMLFEVMGFGGDPASGPNVAVLEHLKEAFGGPLALIADALGLPCDDVVVHGELGVARSDVNISAGTVPAGTIAATRTVITAKRNGEPLMRMITTWYVSADVETDDSQDWQFRESGWRIMVEGDCPLDVSITYPVSAEDYPEMTPGLTAHRPVNSVPYVCEAEAGIRTAIDLPQIIAFLGPQSAEAGRQDARAT